MTSITIQRKKIETASPVRKIVMGVFMLLLAVLLFVLFAAKVTPEVITTFVMTPGGVSVGIMGDWVIHTQTMEIILGVIVAAIGLYQVVRGFGKFTNWLLGVVAVLFVFGFITYAASGKSMNLGGMLSNMVQLSVPIILGAFSGILCERAGVVNIAIEGMMLLGAMLGAMVGSLTNSLWFGVLAAICGGLLLAFVHAVLSIKYRINQVVSGTVINIFSTGFTSFISAMFMQPTIYQETFNNPPIFQRFAIPVLSEIPLIGPVLFNTNMFVYATIIILIVLQVALFRTKWGLRMRAVGEHPKAADTLGIDVFKTRYMAVLLGGALAGFAGAFFTLGSVGRFDEVMTAGKGFIGLAAMLFGNYTPVGAMASGLLFGFADTLGTKLSILGSVIPPEFMAMLPYLVTMVVLAGVIGRSQGPAADGEPYVKE